MAKRPHPCPVDAKKFHRLTKIRAGVKMMRVQLKRRHK